MNFESTGMAPDASSTHACGGDRATQLESYLADRDEPCPSCSYNLRALKGTACPECGQSLTLRVGLETPNLAAFITGLIGISAAFGFCAMLLSWALYIAILEQNQRVMDDIGTLIAEFVINGAMLWVWVLSSGRIRRQAPRARWSLAAACWLLPPLTLILFVNAMR